MLYRSYELRRTVRRGVGVLVDGNAALLQRLPAPVNTTSPVRSALAAAQVTRTLQLTHERRSFGIDTVEVDGRAIGVTEEIVSSTAFGSLVHFRKHGSVGSDEPKVLLVPGLAGHFATLVRPTVATMLADHDVYVADWHNARDVPASAGRFGLDEYIEHLMDFLRAIGPGTHLMGVCQPAVACLAAAAIMAQDDDPAQPAALILLAGPVDTRVNPGRVNRHAARQPMRMFERLVQRVPAGHLGAGRRVYPGFLQLGGFMGMDPRRHVSAFRGLYRDLKDGRSERADRTTAFYDEYFAVLDIAAEFYLETLERVFKNHDLPRGQFYWQGRKVDPALIGSALFTIEGELDDMCRPGQTEAAHALCPGIPAERHAHHVQDSVGHYGVFAGSRFDNDIYPRIRTFIASHTHS